MAHIVLMGNLRQYTGGVSELDLPVATIAQLFRGLTEQFPELGPHLESLAVAMNGQLYQDALLEPIGANTEVHLLPQIAGG